LAKGAKNQNLEKNTTLGFKSLTRRVTRLTRIYKKKAKLTPILISMNAKKKDIWRKRNPWYLKRWILATHLGARVNNNPLHANLQLVAF
jgi:hypothetical protein